MDEKKIKEAFQKVKEDMGVIKEQIESLKRTIQQTDKPTDTQTDKIFTQTHNIVDQTDTSTIPTNEKNYSNKQALETLKTQNSSISIGNRGVQTDRQTNQQTDRQTNNYEYASAHEPLPTTPAQKFALSNDLDDPIKRIEKVTEVINSLDALKKDLRRQFKLLTSQEMLVFATIYQLTDQAVDVDYSLISKKTNLSESSIRDYVQKIIRKGIPLEKSKENNKRILLSISPEFKRIASLDTIISLREL
jgi:hypothetical protein